MEEELSENELEERFYSMLHYVDYSQANVTANQQDVLKLIENAPRSTVWRYWQTSGDNTTPTPLNTPFQKVNTPKEAPKPLTQETKLKEEKNNQIQEPLPKHLSLFQSPVPKDIKKTIEFIENDDNDVVELESSDEDEVIEVALPPKPTITIESSDDEISLHDTPTKTKSAQEKGSQNGEREISASPVPSIVSSVSDDFIRGDCIAFNISSRRPDKHSFDFSLHGADILGTPAKKKKKKKAKESATSTPIAVTSTPIVVEECFATPKSKAKNKKQKNKSYIVIEKSVPNADIYDSDSNQSIIETNKKLNSFVVTEKSLPCADVYETDSNPSETPTVEKAKTTVPVDVDTSDSSISLDKTPEEVQNKKNTPETSEATVDLTETIPNDDIEENIVIGNVTGFTEFEYYEEPAIQQNSVAKFGSTKVPAILFSNLDFDNLKGKEKVCKNRRYSLTTLRAEMEKFYNESWGGENFNHKEIQKNMSRDKSLWAIDPKDKMGSYARKKNGVTCNYCNRPGHRDDTCRLKPPVCFMCGNTGHVEPRCPSKICVNCGSPNHMYSTMCRNCCRWGYVRCRECNQHGHPPSHCPDVWRRYHNTIEITPYLVENSFTKKYCQTFCSGCTGRGHLVHTCRNSFPFSGLPINTPYVQVYKPVYNSLPDINVPGENRSNQNNKSLTKNSQDSTISSATTPSRNDRNKRQSKSPTAHETHVNKKRNVSLNDIPQETSNKSPKRQELQRKRSQSQSKELAEEGGNITKQDKTTSAPTFETMEKAPDFIPICSNNHDKKGQVIQDNEVSDTSDVITSARIYVTANIIDKLKTKEGVEWLKETTGKFDVTIENNDTTSFLSIKGKVGDQEAFQIALRDWAQEKSNIEEAKTGKKANISQQPNNSPSDNIPKNRNVALRHISNALKSLDKDLGEPNEMYKKLNYLQNNHQRILNQKDISSDQLENNRDRMNSTLKKLNMVLLGQAGLADGQQHIKELYSLQDKLINLRSKIVSPEMRHAIGEHFHSIFTSIPRNDYMELINSYNKMTAIMKKYNPLRFSAKTQKKFDTIPDKKQLKNHANIKSNAEVEANKTGNVVNKKALMEKTKQKLFFYTRRLQQACLVDSVQKKNRVKLMRKLHTSIGLLKNPNANSKNLKKMKKVQEQTIKFLKSINFK